MSDLKTVIRFAVFIGFLCGITNSYGQGSEFGVGFSRIKIEDPMGGKMNLSIWYPTAEVSEIIGLGPFEFEGRWDAVIAEGKHELVVLSHGTGGSDLGHRNLAIEMAKSGMVAVAVLHPRNNFRDNSGFGKRIVWEGRPAQLGAVIDFMKTESVLAHSIAPTKIGLFGFSLGGYTVLSLLSGGHDLQWMVDHCEVQSTKDPVCTFEGMDVAKGVANTIAEEYQRPVDPPAIPTVCAVVLADPMAASVSNALLANFPDVATSVYVPQMENQLAAEFHGSRVVDTLQKQNRTAPVFMSIVGGAQHFSFLAPFPPALKAQLPLELTTDLEGFDRPGFQAKFAADLVGFFEQSFADCE